MAVTRTVHCRTVDVISRDRNGRLSLTMVFLSHSLCSCPTSPLLSAPPSTLEQETLQQHQHEGITNNTKATIDLEKTQTLSRADHIPTHSGGIGVLVAA